MLVNVLCLNGQALPPPIPKATRADRAVGRRRRMEQGRLQPGRPDVFAGHDFTLPRTRRPLDAGIRSADSEELAHWIPRLSLQDRRHDRRER
jgi:hypothetical protein